MTTTRFTNYIRYSTTCPTGINPARWQGMLTWARTNGHLPEQTCQCWQCSSGEKNDGDGPSGFDKWQDTKWCP